MTAVNPTPRELHEIERFGLSYSPEQTVQDMEVFASIVGEQ